MNKLLHGDSTKNTWIPWDCAALFIKLAEKKMTRYKAVTEARFLLSKTETIMAQQTDRDSFIRTIISASCKHPYQSEYQMTINSNATKPTNINKDKTDCFMKIHFHFRRGGQLQSFFIKWNNMRVNIPCHNACEARKHCDTRNRTLPPHSGKVDQVGVYSNAVSDHGVPWLWNKIYTSNKLLC
jgi:hypothetical protein